MGYNREYERSGEERIFSYTNTIMYLKRKKRKRKEREVLGSENDFYYKMKTK